jgi:hypothetical protein
LVEEKDSRLRGFKGSSVNASLIIWEVNPKPSFLGNIFLPYKSSDIVDRTFAKQPIPYSF